MGRAGDNIGTAKLIEITSGRTRTRFITLPALANSGCIHGFGTIDAGVGRAAAHARIKSCFPQILEIATVHQVHGKNAVSITGPGQAASLRARHADIVIVSAAGIAAAVRTADCAPVLIFDPIRKLAAAVHTGWKGTVLRVAGQAVEILGEYGSRPADLVAGVGPCIGPCHYQVDNPVITGIRGSLGARSEEVLIPDRGGRARLDLSTANRIILEQAGVHPARIEEVRMCTYCRDDLFFSYRRQGKGVASLYHFIAFTRPEVSGSRMPENEV